MFDPSMLEIAREYEADDWREPGIGILALNSTLCVTTGGEISRARRPAAVICRAGCCSVGAIAVRQERRITVIGRREPYSPVWTVAGRTSNAVQGLQSISRSTWLAMHTRVGGSASDWR
jgi:hypothetical protein